MSALVLAPAPVEGNQRQPDHAFRVSDGETVARTEERILPLSPTSEKFESLTEFAIELEYDQPSFPVEGEVMVHVFDPAKNPIRLGYHRETDKLEVIDWGLQIPIEEAHDLPRLIGRRFLELYSKATSGVLKEEERGWLQKVSEQMDYHRFAATRKLPRYREATLIRKQPWPLVQFIEEKNIRLDASLSAKLCVLNEGDRFGGWFKLDRKNKIVDIKHIVLLPTLEEDLEDLSSVISTPNFPRDLEALLPTELI